MIIPIVVCNMNTLFCLTKFCQGPLLWKRDWLNLFNAYVNGMTVPWLIKDQGDKDSPDWSIILTTWEYDSWIMTMIYHEEEILQSISEEHINRTVVWSATCGKDTRSSVSWCLWMDTAWYLYLATLLCTCHTVLCVLSICCVLHVHLLCCMYVCVVLYMSICFVVLVYVLCCTCASVVLCVRVCVVVHCVYVHILCNVLGR